MIMWILNKMPVQIQTFNLELNQEEVTALAHHRQQVCAVGDQLLCCSCTPPDCAVGDHMLPESKKDQVKKPPEPTQPELFVNAHQEAGLFFRTRPVCDANGRRAATAPY